MIKHCLFVVVALACMAFWQTGCQKGSMAISDAEAAAITSICGVDASEFLDISIDVITKELAGKFPAVTRVLKHENLFAFILKPVAYNGPITLALVIDGKQGESVGLRIIDHVETPHYVRDIENAWFMDRFLGKTAYEYLTITRLQARTESDIVAITGATVTTEAIVNGVNAAFGVFQEHTLGWEADEVPYMVRFEPGLGDGPVENGNLVIRAYGAILGQVSLEEIRAMPSVKRTMSIHSSAGVTQHSFRGTLLLNILEHIDQDIMTQYESVEAIGVDDYISSIKMEEVLSENSVFVMYEDNELPLMTRDGKPGAMRIVVINDIFGQRFTNYLLEIALESEVSQG